MNRDPTTDYEKLAPDEAARVDRICDRFEQAWQATRTGGAEPQIPSYLDGCAANERLVLKFELVALDRAYRERNGLAVRPTDDGSLGIPAGTSGLSDTLAGQPDSGPRYAHAANWPKLPGLELLEVLGSGGMGVVFKARQVALDRLVAVKVMRDARLADAEESERFLQEARAIARLQHSHLVQVYEFGEMPSANGAGAQPYLVLEYVPGGNLTNRLRGSPQPPAEAARLVEAIADAIHYAHTQGVIHRDLKPANVLLTSAATPKVTDFGLAKFLGGSDLTHTGDVLGTPSYMAPEQTAGNRRKVTAAVDVYGLGAILYEVLTGRPPFLAETTIATVLQVQHDEPVPPRRLQPTVPRDVETICLKCLRKEPGHRYASAQELAEDLRRYRGGESIRARPVSSGERVVRWCRRRPLVAGLLTALLVALVGGTTGILWQAHRAETKAVEARQAQELAEANYTKIRETIDRMARLGEDLSHKPEGQALLNEALSAYQVLLQEKGDDPTVNQRKAQAQLRSAEIRFWLRDRQQAALDNLQAREVLERLNVGDREVRRLLARSHDLEGQLFASEFYTRKLAEAERAYHRAIELQGELQADEPDNSEFSTELLDSLLNLFFVLGEQGRWQDAKPIQKRTQALLQPLLDAAPKDPRYLQRQAHHVINLGVARRAGGNRDESKKLFSQALELCRQWNEVEPDKPHARFQQSVCLIHLAELAWGRDGRLDEAEQNFQQAIQVRKVLAEECRHVSRYRELLAYALGDLSSLLRKSGRHREARDTAREAVAVAAKVVKQWPRYPDARWTLAVNHCSMALALEALHHSEEALPSYQAAVAEFETLATEFPNETNYPVNAAFRAADVGRLARAAGRHDDAIRAWRRAAEHWEGMAGKHPDQPSYLRQQVPLMFAIAQLHMEMTNYEAAQEAFRKTLALNSRLVTLTKGEARDRLNKAWNLSNLSGAYEAAGQLPEARDHLSKSIEEFRRLATDFPDNATYASDLLSRRLELARLMFFPRR